MIDIEKVLDKRTIRAKEAHEGKVFNTTSSGPIKVICWNSCVDIEIVFLNTGNRMSVRKSSLVQGTIRDRSVPSLYGQGIVGGKVNMSDKDTKRAYSIWTNMLERCYSEKTRYKSPTYSDCTVSEKFKNFQFFHEWCKNQNGFYIKGWALDKDTILRGCRVYSEDTCAFVPQEINNLILTSKGRRGDCVLGVYRRKIGGKFTAEVRKDGRGYNLGTFDTEVEAFNAYKCAKELYIKEVASRFKDVIDERVYNSLMSWEVNPYD